MKRHCFSLLLIMILVIASACSRPPEKVSQLDTGTARSLPAKVENIEIQTLATSPVRVQVVARGNLPDGCTLIEPPKISRQANTFSITLTGTRPAGAVCPENQVGFEKLVPLDTSSMQTSTYIVTVNGVTEIFQFRIPNQSPTPLAPQGLDDLEVDVHPEQAENDPAAPEQPQPDQVLPAGKPETAETKTPEAETLPADPAAAGASSSDRSSSIGSGSSVEGQTPIDTTSDAGSANCTDIAAFYEDVTVPDDTTFRQGETLIKTWKLRNVGTCTWGPDYSFVFVDGDLMSGSSPQQLPQIVAPGDIFDLSIKLTAPNEGGPRFSRWLINNGRGESFGVGITGNGYIYVKIIVNWIAPPGETVQGEAGCTVERNNSYESEVLALINNYRESNSLNPLTLNDLLTAASVDHNTDMACHDFSDHPGTDGLDWFGRIQNQGYHYSVALENIYNGDPRYGGTPQGAVEWWIGSTVHRSNMLNPDVTQIGIGYVLAPDRKPSDRTYPGYYTTVFASPGD